MMRTLVSGIQPTGATHLGNYLGFIKAFVKFQSDSNISRRFLLIADLHSLSVGFQNPDELRSHTLHTLATLLACGINPEKTILIQQSRLAEHTELMWILGSATTLPSLTSLAQFKDKSKAYSQGSVPVGLVTYPLLQAADILTYRATHVPVGDDQSQHLELARHLARKFNLLVGREFFPVPEMISSNCTRLKSLRDPSIKMSKSDLDTRSRVELMDSAEKTIEKIRRAITDSESKIVYDPAKRPGVSNLVTIFSLFSGQTVEEVIAEYGHMNKLEFKGKLAELINEQMEPARNNFSQLIKNEKELARILKEGEDRARPIAAETLKEAKKIMGFL